MKITIEKCTKATGDKQSIRLMYWYGSYVDESGKTKHNRKREQLDRLLYTKPKDKAEKQYNKETMQLIEAASGQHSFADGIKLKASFYSFFNQVMETKKTNASSSNYATWQACLIQLKTHHPDEGLTFEQITSDWVEGVRVFFDTKAKTKSGNPISKNTASTYFNKMRAVINAAYAKDIIIKNPLTQVKGITPDQNKRVYLTIDGGAGLG